MKKSLPLLSSRQQSIAFGLLLGDGYLYKDGQLQVEQAQTKQKYVEWLHKEFSNVAGKLTQNVKRVHPRTGKTSYSCRFYTKKCFPLLESLFYVKINEKRTKVVPVLEELEERLDHLSLTIWFMDDGGKAQNTPRAAYINVSGFIKSDRRKLQQALENVFALKTTLHKAGGNNQWNIYILTSSYQKFYEIVFPTVCTIPEMAYKLAI